MKKKINLCVISLLAGLASVTAAEAKGARPASDRAVELQTVRKPLAAEQASKVQIAILLDTSNSMDGLIAQAKTQLWKVVNVFNDASQDGKVPFVEVALYEYGNDGLSKDGRWLRQIQPLSRDLDQISEDLFSLTTNGGAEFCGAVIDRASSDLKWDASADVYKAIFIAGNEPFTQGPVEPMNAVERAAAKGIIVNTIHCGAEAVGISSGWKQGAEMSGGKFMSINQDKAVVHIKAPQDAEILKCNAALNKTYLSYGSQAKHKRTQQLRQDQQAERLSESGAAVQRTLTKASLNYSNSAWDLVDASQQEGFDLKSIKEDELPEEMRKMDLAERQAWIAKMAGERKSVQEKIRQLNEEREKFVAEQMKAMAEEDKANTLGDAVVDAVKQQAETHGYKFDKDAE